MRYLGVFDQSEPLVHSGISLRLSVISFPPYETQLTFVISNIHEAHERVYIVLWFSPAARCSGSLLCLDSTASVWTVGTGSVSGSISRPLNSTLSSSSWKSRRFVRFQVYNLCKTNLDTVRVKRRLQEPFGANRAILEVRIRNVFFKEMLSRDFQWFATHDLHVGRGMRYGICMLNMSIFENKRFVII